MSRTPSPDVAELQGVLDDELKYIRAHRHPGRPENDVQRSLVGLALSGGGIRAATTSLGVLQALARMRVLPMVDYLSTVSGGGYIGACFSALLSWKSNSLPTSPDPRAAFTFAPNETPAFSTEAEEFPFRADHSAHPRDVPPRTKRSQDWLADAGQPTDRPHPRAGQGIIGHLRTHGNFLIARTGLFRREALRGIGALTLGGVYHSAAFLLVLLTASAIYLTIIFGLAPAIPSVLGTPVVSATAPDTTRRALVAGSSTVVRTTQGAEGCDPRTLNCSTESATTLHPGGIRDRIARNFRAVAIVFAPSDLQGAASRGSPVDRIAGATLVMRPILLALGMGLISGIVIFVLISSGVTRYLRGRFAATSSEAGDSVEDEFERKLLRRSVMLMLAATLVAVLTGQVIWRNALQPAEQVVWLFVPLAVLTGGWVASFIGNTVILPTKKRWTRRFRSLASASYTIISVGWWTMLAFGLSPLAIYALRGHELGVGVGAIGSLIASRLLAGKASGSKRFSLPPGALRVLLGIVVLLLLTLGGLFFATWLTLHLDTWGGAFVAATTGLAILFLLGWRVDHNKLGPQYFYRDRLAETYLFSEAADETGRLRVFHDAIEMPLDCLHGQPQAGGSQQTPNGSVWRNTAPYHLISAAINLAGSRDLTRKDRKSGYWLFSKLYCGSTHTGFRETSRYRGGQTRLATAVSISGAAASSAIGKFTFFAQAFATVLFNIRLGSWLDNPAHERSVSPDSKPVFWPSYLFREAFLNTTESSPLVNLSDGGHTGDNIGIYPLLQRSCKIIIACDAERDPDLTFGSLTDAMRHAYIDMGIEVDIDLSMIRADPETGLSRSHCAVGRIFYPHRPDQESTLIYIKNSLMGDEPATVMNYRTRCPDFPHESTADQFFDDAQFESYRALGVHLAEHTFGRWVNGEHFKTARSRHAPA